MLSQCFTSTRDKAEHSESQAAQARTGLCSALQLALTRTLGNPANFLGPSFLPVDMDR